MDARNVVNAAMDEEDVAVQPDGPAAPAAPFPAAAPAAAAVELVEGGEVEAAGPKAVPMALEGAEMMPAGADGAMAPPAGAGALAVPGADAAGVPVVQPAHAAADGPRAFADAFIMRRARVGGGAKGSVYLCTERATGATWAVKIFGDASAAAREAEAYHALPPHRHLLRALELVSLPPAVAGGARRGGIVMQFMGWGDLVAFITELRGAYAHGAPAGADPAGVPLETALPELLVAWIQSQLLAVLHHMHAHGLAHCDVKPDNIVVGGALTLVYEHELRLVPSTAVAGTWEVAPGVQTFAMPEPHPDTPKELRYAAVRQVVALSVDNVRQGRDGGRGRLLALPTIAVADMDKCVAIDAATGAPLVAGAPGGGAHAHAVLPVGTPQYTAPEIWMRWFEPHGAHPAWAPLNGAAADVFAAGVTLWAMLRGMLPFNDARLAGNGGHHDAQRAVGAAIRAWRVADAAKLPNGTSDAAVSLLTAMMDHSVLQRLAVAAPAAAVRHAFFAATLAARCV
jgi:serine/threonine protein kinase